LCPGELSPKEREVLRLLGSDLSLPEIARELFVSYNTIKTQTQSIYRKLLVSNRAEAVERSRDDGLI
jgi:LuxR family maltose regulon positive regulatory protein